MTRKTKSDTVPKYGKIKTASELGALIRTFRKNKSMTLERVCGLINVSMRFLSELERGKETAELGKVLMTLHKMGLDIIVQPRGYVAPTDKSSQDE